MLEALVEDVGSRPIIGEFDVGLKPRHELEDVALIPPV